MSLIFSKTLSGLAANASTSTTHGLGTDPDFVGIQYIATKASSVSAFEVVAVSDATNITFQNSGEGASPNFKAWAIEAHSIIQ